jgi:hypothetical protein
MRRSPVIWLAISLLILFMLSAYAPPEKTLGNNARVVYLHGIWVWAALAAFLAAALTGLVGLLTQRLEFHLWSRALGRTGLVFWISYLPISLWAMQANWNGMFLAEPRWRLALIYAIAGLLIQIGLTLLQKPIWASISNLAYFTALLVSLKMTDNVMHPPSPILNSDALRIQLSFFVLLLLMLFTAWQVARLWHSLERRRV